MSSTSLRFHWSDYLVFVASIGLSAAVGVVQGVIDHIARKKAPNTGQDRAKKLERNISAWPASLSVMASTLAAPFVIGVPAEIYAYGSQFIFMTIGIAIAVPFTAHFLFSRFYKLEIVSVYEYLEFRFSKPVRSLCSAIFAFSLVVYIGIITYAPAVVFSKMTGLSVGSSVLGVGLLGILYTTVGGLKGVIWVDAIQMMIILASVLAIIIKGTVDVGGAGEVWGLAMSGGRLERPLFSLDPTLRHSVWTQAIGGSLTIMVVYTNQSIVQKFLGLPTMKKMYITAYVSTAACMIYFLLFTIAGVVIYAYYATCSPLLIGSVKTMDQLVPVYVLEAFNGYYGIAGLFTAAVFSASLSTMAGGINALAAVTFLDVLHPVYKRRNNSEEMPQRTALIVFKLLVIVYGLLTIGMAYLAPLLGRGLMQLVLNLLGMVGAPMLALFLMGIFMPCINSIGASVGMMVSLVIVFIISFGGLYTTNKYKLHIRSILPLSNQTCPVINSTFSLPPVSLSASGISNVSAASIASLQQMSMNPTGIEKLFTVSYMWYPVIALLIAFPLGFLVSWMTGFRKGKPVDEKLSYLCWYKTNGNFKDYEDDEMKMKLNDEKESGIKEIVIGCDDDDVNDSCHDHNHDGDGLFAKNRCSRCRRSTTLACTKF